MAANLKNEEERLRRILIVYNLFIETTLSTRKLAELISRKYFKISNVTVNNYLKKALEILDDEKRVELEIALNERRHDTLDNDDVKNRVLSATKLYLDGAYIEDIYPILNSSYFQIHRDLYCRLPKIDSKLFDKVKIQTSKNKENNLKNSKESKNYAN